MNERTTNVTLGRVIVTYLQNHGVAKRTAKNNALALLKILEVVRGEPMQAELIPLEEVNSAAISVYQSRMVERYTASAPEDLSSQREARERALRTSRSTINQARCLFSKKGEIDLIDIYQAHGISLPSCIDGFSTCKIRGKSTKRDYRAPSDEVVQRSMDAIELMRADRDVYLGFWLALGGCLRKSEIRFLCWQHIVEVNGMPRIMGGTRKNGSLLDVPLQSKAYQAILPFRETTGFIIKERGDRWARRLSAWMRLQGWETRKTLHELRAYTGSQIYSKVSPFAAKTVLGHSSIAVTEKNYLRYGVRAEVSDVL